jgi:hypothetical protein
MTKYDYDAAQDSTGAWRVRHLHGRGRKGFSYIGEPFGNEISARMEAAAIKRMTEGQIADARARAVALRARRKDAQGGPANA